MVNRIRKFSAVTALTMREQLLKRLHSFEGGIAQGITDFAGSMSFVYYHVVWFGFWIVANHGLLEPYIHPFDIFPYGLLTMIVSLEAIFLATFIMIAQNRQSLFETYRELEELQEEKGIESDVQSVQRDLEHIKKVLGHIHQKMNHTEKK